MGLPIQQDATAPKSFLNILTVTVCKTGPGFVFSLAVVTGPCSVFDSATSGSAANLIFTAPAASAVYNLNFAFQVGLLISPGAGTAAVSFE